MTDFLTEDDYTSIINDKVEALNAVLIEACIAHGMRFELPRRVHVAGGGKCQLIIRAVRVRLAAHPK